ncbi:MAG TPA: RloB family protein [Pirellulales bacterium]|nr:RloB family protein [Pirellulales bacterium]
MSQSRRNRDRKPARRPPFRNPKPVILVVCEGKNTEPQYIDGYKRHVHNPRVDIEIAPETGVPRSLVRVAKERKKAAADESDRQRDPNLAYDSVWCVFDIDDHPNVGEAKEMARDNGIELAISNPCFELWLLLHFRENPGMQNRHVMKDMLEKFVPDYDKRVEFTTYADGYQTAAGRARRMDEQATADNDAGRNPTTSVYQLTEQIGVL